MKVRIEISSLATKNLSGISNYTKMLAEALDNNSDIETHASYFNFLNRQPEPELSSKGSLEKNSLVPLRIYAKLQSYNIAPPFDIMLPNVNLTIFPNYATWPTCKSKYRATVIFDLTYLYLPDTVESKNLAHLRRVVPRSIKQADFIITISEAVKNEIINEFSFPPEKCIITTIPPDKKYLLKNNNEIHNKYGIPTSKFIYFIGNLEPRKDLPTLIEAYCKLPATIKKEYSLIMAGGNGWKTEKSCESIRIAVEAGENIKHIGYINNDDAAAFYQKASVFVMPSIYEGFGMPILESMACGCPVIASDITVLREVAGNAALFAKVGDSESFCHMIQKLLNNPRLQKKLIAKGQKQLNCYSWTKNINIIEKQVLKLQTTDNSIE